MFYLTKMDSWDFFLKVILVQKLTVLSFFPVHVFISATCSCRSYPVITRYSETNVTIIRHRRKNSFSLHGITVRFYSDFEIIELSVKMTFPKKLISLFHS